MRARYVAARLGEAQGPGRPLFLDEAVLVRVRGGMGVRDCLCGVLWI